MALEVNFASSLCSILILRLQGGEFVFGQIVFEGGVCVCVCLFVR